MKTHNQKRSLVILIVVLFLYGALSLNFASANRRVFAAQTTCPGPINTPNAAQNDLDHSEDDWGVYCEGTPTWRMQNVATPSIDGESLECAITGGSVQHSNVHCYRNLISEPDSVMFRMDMVFWFTETTCNNEDGESIVQALEFTMNKWHGGKRYEFAVQWQNVGEGAPQWRYWDPKQPHPNEWVAFIPRIGQCLKGGDNNPHTLSMEGAVANDLIELRSFTIDNQTHAVNLLIEPAEVNDPPKLAVAVQVDGNSQQSPSPYSLFIDQVNFIRWSSNLVAPQDGSASVNDRPTFTWEAVPGATEYEMQLDIQYPPTKTVITSSSLSYTPATALVLRDYYWRVRGIDAQGNPLPWTPTQCVMVQSPLQGKLQLNAYSTRKPTLRWNRISWATEYAIEIDDSPSFTAPLEYSAIVPSSAAELIPISLHDCTHYWRVRAKGSNGLWGAWSSIDNFFINAP